MIKITLKLMRSSARMLVPAGIAILIGTAFIAATLLFGNAMDASLRQQLTSTYAQANYIVGARTDGLNDDEINAVAETTVGDFQLERLRAIDGVKGAQAITSLNMEASKDDKHASIIAIGTSSDPKLLAVQVVEGEAPIDNGEIALPKATAKQLGARIGDQVELSIGENASGDADTTAKVRVVGLTEDRNGAYSYYGGAAVLSEGEMGALNIYGETRDFQDFNTTMLLLDLDPSKTDAALEQVKQLLPAHYEATDARTAGDEAMEMMSAGGVSVTTVFLMSFGVLAMLVAALVIANTFQVLVAQRRRTLALLRTIGAKKGQLYASVLVEAGVLGIIASGLGIGAGVGLMALAAGSGLLSMGGVAAGVILTWPVVAVPLGFGVAITVLASMSSARSATAVTPLEALRPLELTDTKRAGRVRAGVGLLAILLGGAMTGWAVFDVWRFGAGQGSTAETDYSLVLLTAIAGCALVFLGLVLSAVFWLPRLIDGFGWMVAHAGPSSAIARANIAKNPRRVAATGAALLIGVTLVSTIATGAASAKETMNDALASRYAVDMIVTGDDLDQDAVRKVTAVDGVKHALLAPTATGEISDVSGTWNSALFIGVDDVNQVKGVVKADLTGARIDRDTALLPRYSATSGKELRFADNKIEARAGGAAVGGDTPEEDTRAVGLTATQSDYRRVSNMVSATSFVSNELFADGTFKAEGHMILLSVDADGRNLNEIFDQVQGALADMSGVTIAGPVAERNQWETMIDTMMALLVGLLAVAVLIALVGVANTLSLSVIERTRESATLRAIGMTRGQLRRSLAVEALLIAVVSGLVGVVMGTVFGWIGSFMVFSLYGQVVFPIEWGSDGLVLLIAALAALAASVLPARRAVRTPPVEALSEA